MPSYPRMAWMKRRKILSLTGHTEEIKRFIKLARSHVHKNFTVPAAARQARMKVRTLHRLALGELGSTPGVIIDLARIVRVAKEIATTEKPLGRIAERYGFRDQSSMNRQFGRFMGLTPGVYRQQAARQKGRGH